MTTGTEATWIFTRVVNGKMGESVNMKLQRVQSTAWVRLVAGSVSNVYIFFSSGERKKKNKFVNAPSGRKPVRWNFSRIKNFLITIRLFFLSFYLGSGISPVCSYGLRAYGIAVKIVHRPRFNASLKIISDSPGTNRFIDTQGVSRSFSRLP